MRAKGCNLTVSVNASHLHNYTLLFLFHSCNLQSLLYAPEITTSLIVRQQGSIQKRIIERAKMSAESHTLPTTIFHSSPPSNDAGSRLGWIFSERFHDLRKNQEVFTYVL